MKLTDEEHSLILEVLDYSLSDAYNCLSDSGNIEVDDEINQHIEELEVLIKKNRRS